MSGKKVVIIGSGINGLVAANYLSKKGFSVSVIEKNNHTGGACTYKTKIIKNQTIDYAYGATVLGMMPNFIFNETGLSKNVKIFAPKHPKLVYFPDSKESTRIYQDYKKLDKEIKNKWGEKGNLESFRMDEDKVVDFIREGCRKGETPTLEKARNSLGQALTDLWIKGSAKNLLDHYFSSDKTKIYMGMTAIESGSSSIKNNGTAFTIPLMDSGSVFNGYWGYVKGGIWQISHEITKINKKIGVHFHMSSNISSIDSNKMKISFKKENKNHEIDYDYLIFATDPITPSKILKNKDLQSKIEDNDFLGTSGKITAFFKNPVIWKESSPYKNSDSAFRFIFSNQTLSDFEKSSQSVIRNSNNYSPGYIQVYAEGAAQRVLNNKEPFDKLIFFIKNIKYGKTGDQLNHVKEKVKEIMFKYIKNTEDCVSTEFLSPRDLNQIFYFPKGNIDHMALNENQNYNDRHFSKNIKKSFYLYGDYENIFYCGAGAYPCGSVAGTTGYMCAKQLKRLIDSN